MKQLFSQLSDRVLRFDGVSIVEPDLLSLFLMRGLKPSELRTTEMTEEVIRFNELVGREKITDLVNEPISFSFDWNIDDKYKDLDVEKYVVSLFESKVTELDYTEDQLETAIVRVSTELQEFERRGLFDLLRVIVYVLDTFKRNNQVYGVGRGSSCASFVLFLMGLHVVDPIKFEVPLEEFMHG